MAGPNGWLDRPILEGEWVRLEPLSSEHLPGLIEIGLDDRLWRWTLDMIATPADMQRYVEAALAAAAAGGEFPLATIERRSGRVVGSTRYLNVDPVHRRLEIGHTWVAPRWQRTAINTEAKLLMLGHAFEVLGCNRVEFKTDSLNQQSRDALIALGAVEEGTLRNHMISQGGRLRHTTYYSVIVEEWPGVRARLVGRLARNH